MQCRDARLHSDVPERFSDGCQRLPLMSMPTSPQEVQTCSLRQTLPVRLCVSDSAKHSPIAVFVTRKHLFASLNLVSLLSRHHRLFNFHSLISETFQSLPSFLLKQFHSGAYF